MVIEDNFKDEIQSFILTLGIDLFLQIMRSGDPITFGYVYKKKYIVFIKLVEVKDGLGVAWIELCENQRKWILKKDLRVVWKESVKMELDKIKDPSAVEDRLRRSMLGLSESFQEKIFASKEPLTLTYIENGVNKQIEASPFSATDKGFEWDVYVD